MSGITEENLESRRLSRACIRLLKLLGVSAEEGEVWGATEIESPYGGHHWGRLPGDVQEQLQAIYEEVKDEWSQVK